MIVSGSKTNALARTALRHAFERAAPGIVIDDKGYVAHAADNLVAGVALAQVEADLRQGDGNELKGKFRAVHSSSALGVNTFGPFKTSPRDLRLAGQSEFSALHFERKCHHGLINWRAPNLDMVAEHAGRIVAVESKCLEFLSPHSAKFSPAYEAEIVDARRAGPYFRHMLSLIGTPDTYRWLDAAQLIKHAFGLVHTFPGRDVTLLYVFWEPSNPDEHPIFAAHRAEVERFAEIVAGAAPRFTFMSYPELWRAWDAEPSPDWLSNHIGQLRARYAVAL